ncbi:AAA family ATPase [Rhodovibrionaceae bacterium A322]
MYLDAIRRHEAGVDTTQFPWTLPLFRELEELTFTAPITFLVGENGSGKSTMLEGLAAGMSAVAMGQQDLSRDPSLATARAFAKGYRFSRRRSPKRRLFLRAEDVFGYVNRLKQETRDLADERDALKEELEDGSWGQRLATGMMEGQRQALIQRYGEDPDAQSHGETFLALLKSRLKPKGLYFLDEPETPLSPQRVLALMVLIKEAVAEGCQFIIATHSPILLAAPDAEILLLKEGAVHPSAFDDIEHVTFTRAFLNNPQAYLKHL